MGRPSSKPCSTNCKAFPVAKAMEKWDKMMLEMGQILGCL